MIHAKNPKNNLDGLCGRRLDHAEHVAIDPCDKTEERAIDCPSCLLIMRAAALDVDIPEAEEERELSYEPLPQNISDQGKKWMQEKLQELLSMPEGARDAALSELLEFVIGMLDKSFGE